MLTSLRSDLIYLWLCATTALCMGMVLNQFRDTPLPWIYQSKAERLQDSVNRISANIPAPATTLPATLPATLPEKLSLQEFSAFVDGNQGLILDARPEIFHRLGHVPGALSLARDDFEKSYTGIKSQLESNREQPLVIYCASASCEDAELVKKSLAALGFTNTSIFVGGWSEWTKANKPEESAQ